MDGTEYVEDVGQAWVEAEREAVNRAAWFLPMTDDGLPSVFVGGVQVFVYLHEDGELRIALHFDEAETEDIPTWGPNTPVTIDVGDKTVCRIDRYGVET